MGRNSKDNSLARYRRVVAIRDNYFYCYHHLRGFNKEQIVLAEEDIGTCDVDYKRYIARVERVFKNLDNVSKMIINKEFFFNDYRTWWVQFYPRSTFYRLRQHAIASFLEAFK